MHCMKACIDIRRFLDPFYVELGGWVWVFPFVYEVSWLLFHKDKGTEAMIEILVRHVNMMKTALQETPVNQLKFMPECVDFGQDLH